MPGRQLDWGEIWAGEISLGVDNLYIIFTEENTYVLGWLKSSFGFK